MNRNSLLSRLLLPVLLLLVTMGSMWAATPITYKIERDAGGTYRVYMSSTTSYTGTMARIGTAQVTLRVPTGSFPNLPQGTGTPTVVGNNSMGWSANTRVNAPAEAPGSDYISFGFSQSATPTLFNIPANQDILLFSFSDTGICPGQITLWSTSDPFQGVSTSTNPGNQISIFANGPGNAYIANYGGPTACPVPDLVSSVGPVPVLTAGQPASLPVSVSNVGGGNASGPIGFATVLPAGISAPASFTGTGGWGCTTTGQSVSCSTPGALSANTATAFVIPITPASSTVGTTPVFSGTVGPAPGETNTANNTAPAVSPAQPVQGQPDLISSVGPVPPLTVGQVASLPVSVSNIGTGAAGGPIGFVSTLPVSVSAPAQFTSINGWGCTTTGQVVSCTTAGPLNAGASTNFAIPITPLTAGQTPVFGGTPATPTPESTTANNAAPAASASQPIAAAGACVATDCNTGVRYGLRLSPDGITYTVYMKSATTYTTVGNQSRISTAQVTINLPTGTQITSTTTAQPGSTWTQTIPVVAPGEASGRDYRSFGYSQASASALFTMPSNVEIPLFSFQRVGPCTGELQLWDTVDPFQGVSTTTNPGNQMTILGNGVPNAWQCNYTCPVACPVPVVSLVKQAPAGITQNTPFSYTLTASNSGNGPTSGVLTVVDVLPTGLTFLSGGGNGWTCQATGQTVSCTSVSSIAAAGSSSFLLTVNPTAIGPVANSATLSGGGSATSVASSPCPTCPVGPATSVVSAQLSDLAISIQQPAALIAGQANTLNVSLTNLLAGTAPGPQSVTIALPNGVAVPASFSTAGGWGCTTTGTNVVCTNPVSVSQGQVLTIPLSITPNSSIIGNSLLFTATVALATNETNSVNNYAYIFSTQPVTGSDLAVTLGPLPTLTPGQPGIIPITISNLGQATVPNALTLAVTLPAGVSLNAAALPVGWSLVSSVAGSGGATVVTLLNANAGGLAPTGSVVLNLPVSVSAGLSGAVSFVAAVTPVPSENNLTNNSSTASTTIGAPDLTVTITGPTPALVVNQPSTIALTVSNVGSASASGPFTTQLTIPAGYTTSLGSLPAGWSVGAVVVNPNGSTTYTLANSSASLSSGQSVSLAVSITPGASVANTTSTFSATVVPAPGETNTINNVGTLAATPTAPGINVTVTLPAQFTAGQTSPVSISFTNNGTAPYTGPLTTQVTLPAGVIPGTLPPGWSITGQVTNPNGSITYTITNPNVTLPIGGSIGLILPVTPGAGLTTPSVSITVVTPVNPLVPSVVATVIQTAPLVAPVFPNVGVTIGTPSPAFSVGQVSILPITFTNSGIGAANGPISTTISIPAGMSINPAQLPSGWVISGTTPGPGGSTIYVLTNASATIAPNGGQLFLNLPVTVSQGAAGTSPTITVVIQPVGQLIPGSGAYVSPVIPAPNMVLTVGQPAPVLTVGQTSLIPVTIQNTGTGTAFGPLTAQVVLPAGVSLNSAALNLPAGWVLSSSTAGAGGITVLVFTNANAGGFAAGGSTSFNVPVIPSASTVGTTPSFTVTLLPVQGQTTQQQQTVVASVAVQAAAAADLTISATQPSPILTVGQASTIAIAIQNVGTATAAGPTVFQIAVPAGLSLNALPSGWVIQSQVANGGGGFTYTIANSSLSLTAGQSTTVILSVTPASSLANALLALGLYVNGAAGEINLANNAASLVTTTAVQAAPAPDLAVSIPAQSFTLALGGASLVSFNVSNIGSAAAPGTLALQFLMPAGFSTAQTSFSTGGWFCATTGSTVNCQNTAGLGINASSALQIPVLPTLAAVGVVNASFQINVLAATGETILGNNIGTINYVGPVQGPDLAVSFPTQSFTLTAGSVSSVSFVVSNVSSIAHAAGPLSLTFAMPTGFSTASATFSSNGWGCTTTGSTVSCTSVAGLSAGASVTLTMPVLPLLAGLSNPTFSVAVSPAIGELNLANNVSQLNYLGTVLPGSVQLAVKMLLQGSYDTGAGLMYDKLRVQNRIPLAQPYFTLPLTPTLLFSNGSQSLTTTSTVLSVTGVNAIVDWVMVELRSAANPATVLAATPALVQRDGDVVSAADGVSSLVFANLSAGSYYVSVRHRNHLGAMSATALPLSASLTTMDFTQTANVYVKPGAGSYPQYVNGGKAMLWAGNTTGDAQVIFQGGNNDIDPVFFRIITDGQNTGQIANFIASGYEVTDVNMDGQVIFQGPFNEVDVIFFNVIDHPANTGLLGNFIVQQHLP